MPYPEKTGEQVETDGEEHGEAREKKWGSARMQPLEIQSP
jgi:hypothetical protein